MLWNIRITSMFYRVRLFDWLCGGLLEARLAQFDCVLSSTLEKLSFLDV